MPRSGKASNSWVAVHLIGVCIPYQYEMEDHKVHWFAVCFMREVCATCILNWYMFVASRRYILMSFYVFWEDASPQRAQSLSLMLTSINLIYTQYNSATVWPEWLKGFVVTLWFSSWGNVAALLFSLSFGIYVPVNGWPCLNIHEWRVPHIMLALVPLCCKNVVNIWQPLVLAGWLCNRLC